MSLSAHVSSNTKLVLPGPKLIMVLLLVSKFLFATSVIAEEEEENLHKDAKTYYDDKQTNTNYINTFGQGNIHFGYFPTKTDEELVDFKSIGRLYSNPSQVFQDAAVELTKRIGDIGQITSSSSVLDLGCGYGKPLMDLANYTKCSKGVGLDIASRHIEEAKRVSKEKFKELNLEWIEGSYLDLPKELEGQFTHVTSNVAFCHLHEHLPTILQNAYKALKPGGEIVAVDYLGHSDPNHKGPSELTLEHVYKRLTFSKLHGHTVYKEMLKEAGFVIEKYEELDKHFCYGYALLEEAAKKGEFRSKDGALLSENYAGTVKSCHELKEIGMNLYKARKPSGKTEL